jgi:hypothetical protein
MIVDMYNPFTGYSLNNLVNRVNQDSTKDWNQSEIIKLFNDYDTSNNGIID